MNSRKRKTFSVMMIAVLVIMSLVLAACGSTATTTVATTAGTTGTTVATTTAAKTWEPKEGITMIVPYGAGGSTDLLARSVEKVWSKHCDQPLTVAVKPGGGGVTGNLFVANAKPDGYTIAIGFGSGSELVMPYVQPVQYKPFEQLRPIARVSIHSVAVAVPENSPYKTMKDLVDDAKNNNKTLTAANSTAAGSVDFVMRGIGKRAGINVTPIPHSGGGPATTTLLAGHTDFGGGHPAEIAAHLKSGKLRALGIALPERDPALPDVPTLKEQGIDLATWGSVKGVAGPIGLPDEIVAYYEKLFKEICEDEEFKKTMQDMLQPVLYQDAKTFDKFLHDAFEDYKKLSDELGIKEAIQAEQAKPTTTK